MPVTRSPRSRYRADAQDFTNCATAVVLTAAGIPATVVPTSVTGTGKGYTLVSTSKSTNTFTITKDPATGQSIAYELDRRHRRHLVCRSQHLMVDGAAYQPALFAFARA